MSFPFTAREVALLGRNPHIRGTESKKDLEIVEQALKLVEAAHFADRSFPTLSGGEQQRVSPARVPAQIWEKPDGKIYQSRKAREVLTAPNIKAVFDFDVSIIEHDRLPQGCAAPTRKSRNGSLRRIKALRLILRGKIYDTIEYNRTG